LSSIWKHESLNGRAAVLTKQREQLSFVAKTSDKSAKTKLAATSAEATTIASDIEIVASALVEARGSDPQGRPPRSPPKVAPYADREVHPPTRVAR
jgi:hypothetical protein